MNKYKISFWNYERTGVIEAKHAVRDWKEAGMNLAMTFEYDETKERKEDMLALLDECYKEGMQAIVCDKRTRYLTLMEIGEESFRKGVHNAVRDFGAHPAVFGFHVGDEPTKDMWESAVSAFTIVREALPEKKPFINMFPSWTTPDCVETLGVGLNEYEAKLVDFVQRTKAEIIAFDCYAQCRYLDRDFNVGEFIRNLRIFSAVAKKTGAELYVSVSSVGHWDYRTPTQDDIRWQLNMSVAHGATGVFWFYFYQRYLEENFREGPINLFGERTPMYDKISFQNRFFMQYYAEKLSDCTVDHISYFHKPYGGYPTFAGEHELKQIEGLYSANSICVTRWKNNEGKICYTLVNADQELPARIKLTFEGSLSKQSKALWLAPGQLIYIDEDTVI